MVQKTLLALSSPRLTLLLLVSLLLLTFWGTLFQVTAGLAAAQNQYFGSYVVFISGVIPFPGALTLLWLIFLNITSSLFTRITFSKNNTGLILIHIGLMFLPAGAVLSETLSYSYKQELTINTRSFLVKPHTDWQLTVSSKGSNPAVTPLSTLTDNLIFSNSILSFQILEIYNNCLRLPNGSLTAANSRLNLPGIRLLVNTQSGSKIFSLRALDSPVEFYDTAFSILPADVSQTTSIALLSASQNLSAAESVIELTSHQARRRAVISLNHPLRYEGFTVYQDALRSSSEGSVYSTLLIKKAPLRSLPYFASIFIIFGLLLHFVQMFIKNRT